jgi:hypothetical protein
MVPLARATFPRLTLCSKIVALRHISAANADTAALIEAASIHRRASLVVLVLSELIGSAGLSFTDKGAFRCVFVRQFSPTESMSARL